DHARRKARVKFRVAGLREATGIPAMTVVRFPRRLLTGHPDLGSVDDDDVVARIDVGRELRLVLPAQPAGDFHGEPAEDLVGGVDKVQVGATLGGPWGEGLHLGASGSGVPNERRRLYFPAPRPVKSEGWKKKRSLCGCVRSTKGGGWRRLLTSHRRDHRGGTHAGFDYSRPNCGVQQKSWALQ